MNLTVTAPEAEVTSAAATAHGIAFEDVPCALCGATDHRLLVVNTNDPDLRRLSRRFDLRFVSCDVCGLVYQTPRASKEAINALYVSRDYRRMPPEVYSQLEIRQTAADQAAWIAANWGEPVHGSALDIGCSSGNLLDGLKASGFSTFGVEPTETYASFARRNGHDIVTSLWSPSDFAGRRFNLISLSHTLEHIHDLGPLFRALRSQLVDDGRIFVEVPLLTQPSEALWDSFFAWYHLYVFSRETLTALLRIYGFEVVQYGVAARGQRVLAIKCEAERRLPAWSAERFEEIRRCFDDYIAGEYRQASRKRRMVKTVGRVLDQLFGTSGKALIRDAYLRVRYRREYAAVATARAVPRDDGRPAKHE